MSNATFGFLVSVIAIFVLIIFVSVLLGLGHNMVLTWINLAFRSGTEAKTEIGL